MENQSSVYGTEVFWKRKKRNILNFLNILLIHGIFPLPGRNCLRNQVFSSQNKTVLWQHYKVYKITSLLWFQVFSRSLSCSSPVVFKHHLYFYRLKKLMCMYACMYIRRTVYKHWSSFIWCCSQQIGMSALAIGRIISLTNGLSLPFFKWQNVTFIAGHLVICRSAGNKLLLC